MLVVLVLVAAGCKQLLGLHDLPVDARGNGVVDGAPDGMLDVSPTGWTIDPTSHKAVPSTRGEWLNFITANGLAIAPPDGLWLLQENGGDLADHIGTVTLSMFAAPAFRQPVAGWSRLAVTTRDNTTDGFGNVTDTALPDLQTAAIAVLVYYAPLAQPTATRDVVAAGRFAPNATVGLLSDTKLELAAGATSSGGVLTNGATVEALFVVLDPIAQVHRLYTARETITPAFSALSGKGITFGSFMRTASSGAYLYMAAWYGAHGQIANADAAVLFAALGF
jgi:hypothetical protein